MENFSFFFSIFNDLPHSKVRFTFSLYQNERTEKTREYLKRGMLYFLLLYLSLIYFNFANLNDAFPLHVVCILMPMTPPPAGPATTTTPTATATRSRPASSGSSNSQLLRKIVVSNVTIEVVRQDNTIIYRLPGNMPVSSLTPEQRTKVMSEIQRMRSSGNNNNTTAAASTTKQKGKSPAPPTAVPQPTSTTGPKRQQRPLLSAIAPRALFSQTPTCSSGASTPPQQQQQQQQHIQRRMTSTGGGATPVPISVKRTHSSSVPMTPIGSAPSTPTSQKTALEKMYQSAYLRLLNGPAEVLRKLSPPIELSSIIKSSDSNHGSATAVDGDDGVVDPNVLLQILKALTKSQASQLAAMHDQNVKSGRRGPLEVGTRGLASTPSSQPASGEVSPTDGYYRDMMTPDSGTATPTRKRKYVKSGKYSTKKQAAVAITPATPVSTTATAKTAVESPSRVVSETPARYTAPPLPSYPSYPHTDMNRRTLDPVSDRRKRTKEQARHESEVSRKFQDALAMDHKMVQSPNWRQPFGDTRDVIQRLLPFHVFQYPDRAIEQGMEQAERGLERSTASLTQRLQSLSLKYRNALEKEGSDGYCYGVERMQLDLNRIRASRKEVDELRERQLARDIALVRPSMRAKKR